MNHAQQWLVPAAAIEDEREPPRSWNQAARISYLAESRTMKKRRQQQSKRQNSTRVTRPTRVVPKELEVFVTDFLTDPRGLPVELRDCVLVADNSGTRLISIQSEHDSRSFSFQMASSSDSIEMLHVHSHVDPSTGFFCKK